MPTMPLPNNACLNETLKFTCPHHAIFSFTHATHAKASCQQKHKNSKTKRSPLTFQHACNEPQMLPMSMSEKCCVVTNEAREGGNCLNQWWGERKNERGLPGGRQCAVRQACLLPAHEWPVSRKWWCRQPAGSACHAHHWEGRGRTCLSVLPAMPAMSVFCLSCLLPMLLPCLVCPVPV